MTRNKFYPTIIKFGANTIYALSFLVLLLNFLSWAVGGVWILISGGWMLVIIGILMSVFMPWFWSILFIPQLVILPFLSKAAEKGNRIWVAILGFVANFYGNVIIVIWTYYIFNFFLEFRGEYKVLPLLLLGYSVALGPLQYMAQKEGPDSNGSFLGVLLSQVSYILISVITLFGGNPSFSLLVLISFIFSSLISTITASSVSPSLVNQSVDQEKQVLECSNCGHETSEDAKYCNNCGYQF